MRGSLNNTKINRSRGHRNVYYFNFIKIILLWLQSNWKKEEENNNNNNSNSHSNNSSNNKNRRIWDYKLLSTSVREMHLKDMNHKGHENKIKRNIPIHMFLLGSKWENFESIHFVWASFGQISSICLFREKNSSISIPKYLMRDCNFNLLLFILISGSRSKCFHRDLNMMRSL